MNASEQLDSIDLRVLRALQVNGRATYDELASQVNLSSSATLRRVKRLEEAGVITGYVALVKPEHVGLQLTAYVNVRIEKRVNENKRNPMEDFAAAVQNWPEVVECSTLSGEMDFMLRIVVADMTHYAQFVLETLIKHPAVQDCKTSFVLNHIKQTTALPL